MAKQKKRKKIRKKRGIAWKKLLSPKHLKLVLAIAALVFIVGIISNAYYLQTRIAGFDQAMKADNPNQTTEEFIQRLSPLAQEVTARNDLYASVLIAQAVLESDSGHSTLSQSPNYNYFGIKGDYQGQSVTMTTSEDDGTGNLYQIDAQFRSYGDPINALEDYAALLQADRYSGVRRSNTTSYQDATAALTGTYATDTSYGTKLNNLIEQYNLTQYD